MPVDESNPNDVVQELRGHELVSFIRVPKLHEYVIRLQDRREFRSDGVSVDSPSRWHEGLKYVAGKCPAVQPPYAVVYGKFKRKESKDLSHVHLTEKEMRGFATIYPRLHLMLENSMLKTNLRGWFALDKNKAHIRS